MAKRPLGNSLLFLIRHTVSVCWTYRARSEHHPKPIHVISWGSSVHHFNSTTCQTKGHGPERTLCKSVCRGEREERRMKRKGRRWITETTTCTPTPFPPKTHIHTFLAQFTTSSSLVTTNSAAWSNFPRETGVGGGETSVC